MTILTLPWPHFGLSPNARVDRRKKVKLIKSHRETGFWLARQAKLVVPDENRVVVMVFHKADAGRFDADNLLACCKPMIDGVCDHLGIDDSEFDYVLLCGDKKKGGCVRMGFDTRTRLLDLVMLEREDTGGGRK